MFTYYFYTNNRNFFFGKLKINLHKVKNSYGILIYLFESLADEAWSAISRNKLRGSRYLQRLGNQSTQELVIINNVSFIIAFAIHKSLCINHNV